MVSNDIFKYSEIFLEEIVDNIIKLKPQNLSNPKNNEYESKLKAIIGKNLVRRILKILYRLVKRVENTNYTLFPRCKEGKN